MMKTKPIKSQKIESRVLFTDPALIKKLEAARKSIRPIPGWKPFLEMLIEQGLQFKPQPEGER